MYEIKSNPRDKTEKNLSKLILNSLTGRFGMDPLKTLTKLVDLKTHNLLSITKEVKNSIEIGDDIYLDSYKPGISQEICNQFNVDHIKALNSQKLDEKTTSGSYKSVSISTAAAVISYARIFMAKIKLSILEKGGKLYYTDTDSIITDIELPKEITDEKELGKFKLEHLITEGYFIADKTYAIKNSKGEIIKRAKGVNSNSLSFENYKAMYRMEKITNAMQTTSIRDYNLGSVRIIDKHINLNTNNYNKRKRCFNSKG